MVIAGVAAYYLQTPEEAVGDVGRPSEGVTQAVRPPRAAVPAAFEPGMPTRVVIPTLEVDAPVVPINAAGNVLVPPADPQQLGWWAEGARPGAARGSALVTGHTVHNGGGALDHLDQLSRGDRVRVRTLRGSIDYVVRGVEVFSKGITAQRAQQLFSQKARGRLVLITCTDWDGTRYLSNTVVTATEASG